MAHVFRGWFLSECWRKGLPSDWCPYWYGGCFLMPNVAPMYYWLTAITSILGNLDALAASKWTIFFTFPLSATSFYLFAYDETKNLLGSLLGSLAYTFIPWHFTYITRLGNPQYSLCFIFLPWVFLWIRRAPRAKWCVLPASLSLVGLILSHQGTGLIAAYLLVWYVVVCYRSDAKVKGKAVILTILVGIGLSAFFWMPYLWHSLRFVPLEATWLPYVANFSELVSRKSQIYMGWIYLSLLALSCVVTAVERLRGRDKGVRYILMILLCLFLTLGANWRFYHLVFPVKHLSASYRFNIFTAFFLAILLANVVPKCELRAKFSTRNLAIIGFSVILAATMIYEGAGVAVPNWPFPQSHLEIYDFLSEVNGTYYMWWIPRWGLGSAVPVFTGQPSVDGWYDQVLTPDHYSHLHRLHDDILKTNATAFLEEAKGQNARFLIVSKMSVGSFEGATICSSLIETGKVSVLLDFSDVTLLEVKDVDQEVKLKFFAENLAVKYLSWLISLFSLALTILWAFYPQLLAHLHLTTASTLSQGPPSPSVRDLRKPF